MLKLLMRYWDPQRGKVTLSGTPLPQIDVHARRRIQAMMSQETHLFDGTIRENLLIALPESEIRNGERPVFLTPDSAKPSPRHPCST